MPRQIPTPASPAVAAAGPRRNIASYTFNLAASAINSAPKHGFWSVHPDRLFEETRSQEPGERIRILLASGFRLLATLFVFVGVEQIHRRFDSILNPRDDRATSAAHGRVEQLSL